MEISKNKTIFILDWDDTLFPTNWVMKNGINLMTKENRDQYTVYFRELDRVLSKFLKNLISMGKVIIVTNALLDWVNMSSIVLPITYDLLKNVSIVSARGKYRAHSQNMMDWKIMAFRDIIDKEFENHSSMNVISIGDAEYEYQALIALNKKGIKKYLKSVRFMKDPTHDTLIDQIEVLNIAIPKIWIKYEHLDLLFKDQAQNHTKNHVKKYKHKRKYVKNN